ncbi:A24 family peptidase [Paenibacillus planticolens]|uniref:A24 family peptidase n=1 Tax=Paenibacillus planticolens TaxID=2654976 RepID=UPI001490F4DC|nr:A24 family peptidase [Paenibacillus planticolens]
MIFISIAFVTDARSAIIPNRLTVCGTLTGLAFHVYEDGWNGLVFALAGAGGALISLILLYLIGALGAGDVKLFTAVGAMMGLSFVLKLMLYSILIAGIIGLILLIMRKRVAVTGQKLAKWLFSIVILHDVNSVMGMKHQTNMKFPFMYAVVPGAALTWYYSFL